MFLSCLLDDKIRLSNLPPVEADGFFDAIIRFKDLLGSKSDKTLGATKTGNQVYLTLKCHDSLT